MEGNTLTQNGAQTPPTREKRRLRSDFRFNSRSNPTKRAVIYDHTYPAVLTAVEGRNLIFYKNGKRAETFFVDLEDALAHETLLLQLGHVVERTEKVLVWQIAARPQFFKNGNPKNPEWAPFLVPAGDPRVFCTECLRVKCVCKKIM